MQYQVHFLLVVIVMMATQTGFPRVSLQQKDQIQKEKQQDTKGEPQELSDMQLIERVEIFAT